MSASERFALQQFIYQENIRQGLLAELQRGEFNPADWLGYEDILNYRQNLLVHLKPRKTEGFTLVYGDVELGDISVPANLDQVVFVDVEEEQRQLKELEDALEMPGAFTNPPKNNA